MSKTQKLMAFLEREVPGMSPSDYLDSAESILTWDKPPINPQRTKAEFIRVAVSLYGWKRTTATKMAEIVFEA